MTYFRKIMMFAMPYRKFAFLNIICNIFYAIFSTLSFIALIPVIQVLFDKTKRVAEKPVYTGISNAKDYFSDYFNYEVTQRVNEDEVAALVFICGIVVLLFFLKTCSVTLVHSFLHFFAMAYFVTFVMRCIKRYLPCQYPIFQKKKR